MNKTYSLEGVQAILSYPFKSPKWQSKFAIGAALFFANYVVPILPSLFIMGYFAQVMRGVIVDHAEPSLPEWDDWNKLLSRGFKVTAAMTIYLLPALLLIIGGYLLAYVPVMIMSISSNTSYESNSPVMGLTVVGILVGILMMMLGFVLIMPLTLILLPAISHLVAKDSFTAAFRVREWWAILRANMGGFLTALVVLLGVYMALVTVTYALYFTIILCFVLPIVLSVVIMYLYAVAAPLLGEAYRQGVENLAAAATTTA